MMKKLHNDKKKYLQNWKKNNPDYFKKWRLKNRKKINAYMKEWRDKNPDTYKKYYNKNRKKILDYQKKWREDNKDYYRMWESSKKNVSMDKIILPRGAGGL